ncbi:hypothetical protein BKA57DRAFT_533718 [Linnemannia elongata]|nr:hypothetical protein BKA57DRAFT_533718 [Linnemannia elongata]
MGASYCRDPEGWGPTVSSRADLTLCFESTILLGLPAAIAIVAFLYRARTLLTHQTPHGLGKTWILYGSSQLFSLAACIALIVRAIVLSQQSEGYAPSSMLGTSLLIVAWLLVPVLNFLEVQYEVRASHFIFAYSALSMVAGVITTRTLDLLGQNQEDQFKCFIAFLAFNIAHFATEAWPRGRTTAQQKSQASRFEKANLFSLLTFHFLQHVVSLGYKRPLNFEDVDGLMPKTIRTEYTHAALSAHWEAHVKKRLARGQRPSLIKVVFLSHGARWARVMVLSIASACMTYVAPQLLNALLGFIESYQTITLADGTLFRDPKPVSLGIILAFGLFFSTLTVSFMTAQYFAATSILGLEIRTALIAMIYRKSLKLSTSAKQDSTAGEISNHMSVDAERWPQATMFIPMLISVPFQIGIAIWMLYQKLGWSVFVGLGSIGAMLPIHIVMGKYFGTAKAAKLAAMDGRLRLVNEVLAGIKIVKLYNWEESFKEKLRVARGKELKVLRQIGYVFSVMAILFSSTPLIVALVSFSCYATVGGPDFTPGKITPQIVFVSTSLFALLSAPISMLSQVLNMAISVWVATTRIQKFLLVEEIDESTVEREDLDDTEQDEKSPVVIEIKDGVFAWCKEQPDVETDKEKRKRVKAEEKKQAEAEKQALKAGKPAPPRPQSPEDIDRSPTLMDINLQVTKGSLTAIVGRVGQGKTSLLSALIGDMYKRQGSVRIRGQVTYAAQQAWILNATLKDNITFGQEFDQKKYDHVIYVSGLLPDIAMLPAGDQTEIGERGINLSGGQKQRVSLARAAYQDADVYLFDDPLSAVDAHVDQHLWENLIGPNGLLKDKTRVLVTHGIHHLEHVDQIVVVKDKRISENGRYEELMETKGAFFQLINEYSINSRREKKNHKVDKAESSDAITEAEKKDGAQSVDGESATTQGGQEEQEEENEKEIIAKAIATKAEEKLVAKEKMMEGNVSWGVYKSYLRAASYRNAVFALFLLVAAQACQIGTNIWLKHWTTIGSDGHENSPAKFLGVYAALVFTYMMLHMVVTFVVMVMAGIRASRLLHEQLLNSILHLPMAFFDTTPLGRIVNRFSTDIYSTDDTLPFAFMAVLMGLLSVLGSLIVIGSGTPIFLSLVPPLTAIFSMVQVYYIASSRSLKRIDSVSRSPIYQHFSETLTGVSTIRAMNVGPRFILDNAEKTNVSANAWFTFIMSNRWLQIRLEALGATIVLGAGLFAVLSRNSLNTSTVGLSITYALSITEELTWAIRSYSDLANQLVSVERIDEYVHKNPEAPSSLPADANLPENWPQTGHIEFRNYSTRYRQGLELVVKDISFEVQPAEKVGIVGRTGAGKSSLTLALFRIVEAANSHWAQASHNGEEDASSAPGAVGKLAVTTDKTKTAQDQFIADEKNIAELERIDVEQVGGSIWIDGVDISTVGLSRLRKNLAIIPQDPTLFAGTVRENLDPFDELEDADLWEALERAHLKDQISALHGGLSFKVSQNGDNFSVGQRSLICLARALLRKTKVLILDEATAAVDVETDELIQRTIRKEFKDRTILTIAHRIKTVMDSDKILVLEKGRVEEFEPPQVLLQRPESHFYKLAEQAGEVKDASG